MTNGDNSGRSTGAPDRRAQTRQLLLTLIVMLLLVLAVFLFKVPNPNMLLITGLAVFTSLYGYGTGIVCSVVMVVYSMYFFSTDHSMFAYTALNLQKMAVIVLGVVLTTLFIGNLKRRQQEANARLLEMNAKLSEDNEALEAASNTDSLTGMHNRFALRRDYSRFDHRDVHVMMLDLDDFKSVNDRFGHSAGDYVLQKMGQAMLDSFGGEWCYRYGGDEFLVIVPDISEGDFLGRLEAMKGKVLALQSDAEYPPIHFSAGYVHGVCELSYDLRLMMHQADSNLYDAKELGKDCYVGRAFSRVFAESLPTDADGFGKR